MTEECEEVAEGYPFLKVNYPSDFTRNCEYVLRIQRLSCRYECSVMHVCGL